jgi:lipid-binding SYLF domain-containing protein
MLALSLHARADARSADLKRIQNSREAFHELMQTPDHAIPHELLESAKCIAIIPGEKKAAYIVGGRYGRGVAMCRTDKGWSGPVFLKIIGGSFGLQIGGSSTDVIMVFRNREGLQRLLSDKFKIGADVTAAAGPVGRDASAATDIEMHAEILTYSRSRGIFAGVSLDGSVVEPDRAADQALYGAEVNREDVLNGKLAVPAPAHELVAEIRRYTEAKKAAHKTSGD